MVLQADAEDRRPKRDTMTWEVIQMLAASAERPTPLRVKQHLGKPSSCDPRGLSWAAHSGKELLS